MLIIAFSPPFSVVCTFTTELFLRPQRCRVLEKSHSPAARQASLPFSALNLLAHGRPPLARRRGKGKPGKKSDPSTRLRFPSISPLRVSLTTFWGSDLRLLFKSLHASSAFPPEESPHVRGLPSYSKKVHLPFPSTSQSTLTRLLLRSSPQENLPQYFPWSAV